MCDSFFTYVTSISKCIFSFLSLSSDAGKYKMKRSAKNTAGELTFNCFRNLFAMVGQLWIRNVVSFCTILISKQSESLLNMIILLPFYALVFDDVCLCVILHNMMENSILESMVKMNLFQTQIVNPFCDKIPGHNQQSLMIATRPEIIRG